MGTWQCSAVTSVNCYIMPKLQLIRADQTSLSDTNERWVRRQSVIIVVSTAHWYTAFTWHAGHALTHYVHRLWLAVWSHMIMAGGGVRVDVDERGQRKVQHTCVHSLTQHHLFQPLSHTNKWRPLTASLSPAHQHQLIPDTHTHLHLFIDYMQCIIERKCFICWLITIQQYVSEMLISRASHHFGHIQVIGTSLRLLHSVAWLQLSQQTSVGNGGVGRATQCNQLKQHHPKRPPVTCKASSCLSHASLSKHASCNTHQAYLSHSSHVTCTRNHLSHAS